MLAQIDAKAGIIRGPIHAVKSAGDAAAYGVFRADAILVGAAARSRMRTLRQMNTKPNFLRGAIIAASFVALACFYAFWSWSTVLADFGGDNAVYWLTANYWSPWGTAIAPAGYFASTSIYPPLYPIVLAALGGGESLIVAHIVSAGFIVLAFIAIYRFAIGVGVNWWVALTLVVLFAGTRITLIEALQIHSEHLYLVLTYTALCLAQHKGDRRTLYLAAACVAGAFLTRTFGLTLAVTFLAWLAITRSRGLPACAAIVGLPVVLWSSLHGGSSQYLNSMAEMYGQSGIALRLSDNLNYLWIKWLYCFGETEQAGFSTYGPAAIALVCGCGTLVRIRAGALDGLYALAYLLLLVVWPYPAEYERLLYPILPLLFVHGLLAGTFLMQGWMPAYRPAYAAILYTVLLLATELPFALLAGSRLADVPDDAGFAPYTRSVAWFYADPGTSIVNIGYQRGITEALADIRDHDRVPTDECMLSIKPSIVALYSGRSSRGPPPSSLSPQALLEQVREGPCNYLFLMQSVSPSFPVPYYPYRRLEPHLEIVASYANPVAHARPAAMLGRIAERPNPRASGDGHAPALH